MSALDFLAAEPQLFADLKFPEGFRYPDFPWIPPPPHTEFRQYAYIYQVLRFKVRLHERTQVMIRNLVSPGLKKRNLSRVTVDEFEVLDKYREDYRNHVPWIPPSNSELK